MQYFFFVLVIYDKHSFFEDKREKQINTKVFLERDKLREREREKRRVGHNVTTPKKTPKWKSQTLR